jgi:hypothetical protein
MKNLIIICASLLLSATCFSAGTVGVNPPQSGIINPATGTTSITNTFAYPFQSTPIVVVYAAATNSTPITNSITKTNFVLSWPAAGSTNASFTWQAFVGGTRMQSGTQAMSTTSTNVAFPNAYSVAPVVIVNGSATSNAPAVSSITTTNFTITIVGSGTMQWISVGTVKDPQTEYQGKFPKSNPVIY